MTIHVYYLYGLMSVSRPLIIIFNFSIRLDLHLEMHSKRTFVFFLRLMTGLTMIYPSSIYVYVVYKLEKRYKCN